MFHTVLFDLDGTLTDPELGITNSVAYALKKWGIEVEDKRSLRCFIGPPLKESFMERYSFSREDALKSIEYYREYYRDQGIYENELIPGTEWILEELKRRGKRIILATSKPEEFAEQILKYFHIDGYFDVIAGATMGETRNLKSEVIAYALERAGITKPEGVIMVGDREHDVLGAKECGIPCIGVLFGFGSREELTSCGAAYIAGSMEEVFSIIQANE